MYDFRTDLADERTQICKSQSKKHDLDGIETETKKISDNLEVTKVRILNEEGSKKIDKKIGTYTTINIKDIEIIDQEKIDEAFELVSDEIKNLLKDIDGSILVVGLGNEDTTADSIGPKVIKNLEITRHILKYKPELLPEKVREISAIAPGVLGTTGIETQEIIKSVAEKIDAKMIIVIDALASNNISRLLKTIQICDTGIVPGSGVQNKRKEISKDTMNVPVIAIGIPTVVEAATIVANTFDILTDNFEDFEEFSFLKDSSYEDKYTLIKTVLEPCKYNLAVMPKEIDDLVDNMKEIISKGINKALKIN